jgi:hypothetical protein
MSISVRSGNNSVTFEGTELIVTDNFGNDALKIEVESNGTLATTFLQQGAWGVGQRPFANERKATLGYPNASVAAVPKVATKPKINWNSPDPHYYYAWNSRGLTIRESVYKALDRVRNQTFRDYEYAEKGDRNEMHQFFGELIAEGYGRDYIYRLAGRAKNELEDYEHPLTSSAVITKMKQLSEEDGTY